MRKGERETNAWGRTQDTGVGANGKDMQRVKDRNRPDSAQFPWLPIAELSYASITASEAVLILNRFARACARMLFGASTDESKIGP